MGYRRMDLGEVYAAMPEVAATLKPEARRAPVQRALDPEYDEPEAPAEARIHRASYAPDRFSTCRDLMPLSALPVFDVNGYYQAIGILPPFKPTRTDLRRAYQDTHGDRNEYATYAFKRLLDPVFRAHYDRRPWGQPVDDKYRWLEVKKAAAKWAAQETMRTGRLHTERDFIGEEIARKIEADAQQQGAPVAPQQPVPEEYYPSQHWQFGFYLWGSTHRDEARLEWWASLLSDAAWEAGVNLTLAVGLHAHRPEPALRAHHTSWSTRGVDIAFLHEDEEPDPELAKMIIDSFLTTPPDTALESPIAFGVSRTVITLETVIRDATGISSTYAARHLSSSKEDPMSEDVLEFTTGGKTAADVAKAEAAARKARYSHNFITSHLADDGDTVVLRFITDEPAWIETKQHAMVKTKGAPKDKPSERDWPDKMGAVCRYTPVGSDRHAAYGDCYICDYMTDEKGKKYFPAQRLWALAALREPVLGTQDMVQSGQIPANMVDQVISYKDVTEEVDEMDEKGNATGKKKMAKQIVIVNMAHSNFFSPLLTFHNFYKTVVDRDYAVIRKGEKGTRKPMYEFAPMNPVHVQHPDTKETVVFDLRDPVLAASYEDQSMDLTKLRKYVSQRCSKDFYDRYFDPRVEVSWNTGNDDEDSGKSKPAAQPSAAQQAGESTTAEPTGGVTQEKLAAMRSKLVVDNPTPAQQQGDPSVVVAMPLS